MISYSTTYILVKKAQEIGHMWVVCLEGQLSIF